MQPVQLKLKQASAVLGVAPKELQNLVQFGVVRPRKRADVYWFDTNLLLEAKVAFYVKASLCPAMDYLAQFTKALSRVKLAETKWDALLLASAPAKGKCPIEIKIPLKALKKELEEGLPFADTVRDLPRGRRRAEWKQEFKTTLQQAGDDIGKVSDQDIVKQVRAYRNERKKQPEITLVTKAEKSA
jgi:hypothetical protein